jgi:hypothetical protein
MLLRNFPIPEQSPRRKKKGKRKVGIGYASIGGERGLMNPLVNPSTKVFPLKKVMDFTSTKLNNP